MAVRCGPRPLTPTCTDPGCPARSHLTATGYRAGCRTPQAREAWRLYNKRLREHRYHDGLTDATGTIRRIRALAVLGWSCTHIGKRIGIDSSVVREIARGERGTVLPRTAREIAAVFAELATSRGPVASVRTRALSKGWAPPAAWDDIDDPGATPNLGDRDDPLPDEIAVERLLHGQARVSDVRLADRLEAVRRLRHRGMDATAIAYALRTNSNTVRTLLAAITKEAADAA